MTHESRWITGFHAVRAALQRGRANHGVWVDSRRSDRRIREIITAAREKDAPVIQVTADELDELTGSQYHQGVAAKAPTPQSQDEPFLKALLKRLDTEPFLLVLDGVQDPHNLGACLRTADAAGVHAVIAPRDRSAGLNATVCKVASGAAESVPFIQVTNLSRTLKWLKQEGIWLVGTAGEAQQQLYQADLRGPLAILMGSEGKGLRRLTREHCDLLVRLPMLGTVESLNVSVAAGVALYEALRQRSANRH